MKLIFSKRLQAQAWPTLSTQPIIFYALTGFLVIQLIAPVLSAAHPTYAASPEPHGDENGHRDPESKDHSLLQTELIRPISIEPHLRTLVDLLHSINQAADDGHVGSGSDQMAEIADVWFEIEKANVITNLYFEQLEEDLVNRGLFHSIPTLETTRLAYQAEFNHLQLSYETFQKRMTVRAERHALALSAANFQAVLENSESLWPDHPEPNLVALDANRIEVKRLDPSVELSTKSYEPLSVTASEKTRRIAKSTSDVEITPELIALAASLDNDPIKIYEYVYNHIRFDPYYGGRKGALLTLWERSGNDVDIAALTIALLRASGYQARFVQGEAVFEEEELINWIGDPATFEIAADIFATMGMTVTLTSDNQLVKPHVWVEYNPVAGPPLSLPGDLYLPLVSFQSSGFNSISSNKHIEHIEISSRPFETDLDYRTEQATWIPLDTSFKQYTYHAPFDFSTVTGFDAESWIDEMRPTMLFSDTEKSILSLPTLPDLENPGSDYSIDYVEYKVNEAADAVAAYIQANPDLTNRDLLGGDYIITQTVSAIPALPFQIWAERPVIQFEQLPESLKNKVTIEVYAAEEKPIVSYTTSWAEVANKRITISYEAGSAADQATIDSYGALINTPPVVYLVPVLKINGVEVGRAQEFSYLMGSFHTRSVTVENAHQVERSVTNRITVGEIHVVGLNYGRTSEEALSASQARLTSAKSVIPKDDAGGLDLSHPLNMSEPVIGEALNAAIIAYNNQVDIYTELTARKVDIRWSRGLSVGFAKKDLSINYFFGLPLSTNGGGMSLDIQRNAVFAFSLSGNPDDLPIFYRTVGHQSSVAEHSIFEDIGAPSLSTMQLLNTAMRRGVPVYRIDETNRDAVLPKLKVSSFVENNVTELLDLGFIVTISEDELRLGDWVGVGYIYSDPETGAAGYIISGGLAGSLSVSNGGSIYDLLETITAYGWLALNIGLDLWGIYAGVALLLTPGINLLTAIFAVGLIAANLFALGFDVADLNGLARGDQSASDYIGEQIAGLIIGAALKRLGIGFATRIYQRIGPDAVRPLIREISEATGGASDNLIAKGFSEEEIIILTNRISRQETWRALDILTDNRGADFTRQLLNHQHINNNNALERVIGLINEAPGAPGLDNSINKILSHNNFGYPYELQRAISLSAAGETVVEYGKRTPVTFRRVTGVEVDANGRTVPIFGEFDTQPLEGDIVLSGDVWIDAKHRAQGNTVHIWNQIQKAQVAIDEGIIEEFRFEGSASIGKEMRDWAAINAPDVEFVINIGDGLP